MIKAIVPKDSQAQLALKTIKMRLIYSVSFFSGICPTLFSVLLIQITLSIHLMAHSPIICSLRDLRQLGAGFSLSDLVAPLSRDEEVFSILPVYL